MRSTAYSKPTNLGTQKGHSSKIVSGMDSSSDFVSVNLKFYFLVADEKEDNSEEAIFCLTPSTLFMVSF